MILCIYVGIYYYADSQALHTDTYMHAHTHTHTHMDRETDVYTHYIQLLYVPAFAKIILLSFVRKVHEVTT